MLVFISENACMLFQFFGSAVRPPAGQSFATVKVRLSFSEAEFSNTVSNASP